jgi:multidrug efflux pump subunit AcrA (membrane-fusion protein)
MRLTIRDLLWLILVAAIALASYRADRQRAAELQAAGAQFEKWRVEIQTETAETLRKNRVAALNPGAYQDWLKHTNEERVKARQALVQQLGIDDEKP